MSLARFNMSHGTSKQNAVLLKKYMEAKRLRPYKTCALMMDLRGRAIRLSKIADPKGFTYQVGDKIEIRTDGYEIDSTKEEFQINYFDLPPVMRDGDMIILGDNGQLKASVTEIARTSFIVKVEQAGTVYSQSVVKIPGQRIAQLPILQLDDKIDIKEIAAKSKFDYLIVPQVQAGRDIQEVKLMLGAELQHV